MNLSPSLFTTSGQAFIISDWDYFYYSYLFSLATSNPIYLHSQSCIFTVQISLLPLLKSFTSLFITLKVRSLCIVNVSLDDWPLTGCPTLPPALPTLHSVPQYGLIIPISWKEPCNCLLLCLCSYCFPFLNTLLSPLAHLGNSFSFFSTQLNCYLL